MFSARGNQIVPLRAFCIYMLMKISHAHGIHKQSKEQARFESCTQGYPPVTVQAACSCLEDDNFISASLLSLFSKEVFTGLEHVKRTSFCSGLAQNLLFSGSSRDTRRKP